MNLVPIIVGPTAVGKTGLALALAAHWDVEIVSADSRQIYRYMDIGTAKPTPAEQARAPHYFIDVKNPDEAYNAGAFGKDARKKIAEIQARNKLPLVVGGAGFYVRAMVDGLASPPGSTPEVKALFQQRFEKEGLPALRRQLADVDPAAAEQIHPNDTQRTLRALEVYHISGEPFSGFKNKKPDPAPFEPYFIGLNRKRDALYKIIEQRVDAMLAQGLVDEVQRLISMGYSPELNAMRTVGYMEVCRYFAGEISHAETVSLIKKNSRNYAKRQLTWFRADERVRWFELNETTNVEALVQAIIVEIEDQK